MSKNKNKNFPVCIQCTNAYEREPNVYLKECQTCIHNSIKDRYTSKQKQSTCLCDTDLMSNPNINSKLKDIYGW